MRFFREPPFIEAALIDISFTVSEDCGSFGNRPSLRLMNFAVRMGNDTIAVLSGTALH